MVKLEVIKELAKQADISVRGHYDETGSTYAELQKFAELIVEECASLFPRTFTDEQYQRRIDRTIRKHFGVKA